MRANVVLPDDLIAEIDKLAGSRGRSAFLAEAARDRIRRAKFDVALKKSAGILKDDPRFSTRAKIRKYIRDYRRKNSFRYSM